MMKTTFQRLIPYSVLAISVLALHPATSMADTILNFDLGSGAVLSGNATVPPTAFCGSASNCPGNPTFGLATSEPLSGTISFDLSGTGSTGTLSFDLTLTQNATLGSVVVDAGSTFIGTGVGVEFSSTTSKKGGTTYSIAPGSTASTVSVNLLSGSSFTETAGQPSIPGIECSANAASGGSCIFTIGTEQAGTQSLEINQGGTTYNGVLSISAPLTPVPLPASGLLLLGGIGQLLLGGMGLPGALRRRAPGLMAWLGSGCAEALG